MKKALSVILAAAMMTTALSMTAMAGQWQKSEATGQWWYDNGNGTYPAGGIRQVDGQSYFFDANGYMLTGWIPVDGYYYYADPVTGVVAREWVQVDGLWYYMDPLDAFMKTGWLKLGSKQYYLDDVTGAMKTGTFLVKDEWYTADETGKIVHNKQITMGDQVIRYDDQGRLTVKNQQTKEFEALMSNDAYVANMTEKFLEDLENGRYSTESSFAADVQSALQGYLSQVDIDDFVATAMSENAPDWMGANHEYYSYWNDYDD